MSQHLKTRVINGLKSTIATFVDTPASSRGNNRHRTHSGVRYFRANTGIEMLWGAMDAEKLGRKYRKRIVVRPSRFRIGLHELYTYHFPKTWSAACVANRNLIKEAQRQAHALEHANTPESLEWKLRFFHHYFNVVKGHATPEPGLKPYTRFYQYTYVSIYRHLQAQAREAKARQAQQSPVITDARLKHFAEDVTFEPIYPKINRYPHLRPSTQSSKGAIPIIFANKFAYLKKKQYLCTLI